MATGKTIDNSTAISIAAKASCDPRTVRKVLRGEKVRGGAGERARKALVRAGLLPPTAADLQEIRWVESLSKDKV